MSTLTPEERELTRHCLSQFIEDSREAVESGNAGPRAGRMYSAACSLMGKLLADGLHEEKSQRFPVDFAGTVYHRDMGVGEIHAYRTGVVGGRPEAVNVDFEGRTQGVWVFPVTALEFRDESLEEVRQRYASDVCAHVFTESNGDTYRCLELKDDDNTHCEKHAFDHSPQPVVTS